MDFIFLSYFPASDKILCQICVVLLVFQNIVSTRELDQSSLACTNTKHQTQFILLLEKIRSHIKSITAAAS